jgi:hypothetical protein
MKLSNLKDMAVIGALAGAGYLAYKFFNKGAEALTATGEAIGSGVFDLFHPDGGVGETLFYTVHFSNGNHAIPASTVDTAGRFTYQGEQFVMRDKVNAAGVKEHWAFAG